MQISTCNECKLISHFIHHQLVAYGNEIFLILRQNDLNLTLTILHKQSTLILQMIAKCTLVNGHITNGHNIINSAMNSTVTRIFMQLSIFITQRYARGTCICHGSVFMSICHKSVFYQNGWTNRPSSWNGSFLPPILHYFI